MRWLSRSDFRHSLAHSTTPQRSRPYGSKEWVSSAVAQFGLDNTLRSRGGLGNVPDTSFPPNYLGCIDSVLNLWGT